MFCFVNQTATDWTNSYCRYVFDLFSTVVEFILTATTFHVLHELRLALLHIILQVLKHSVRWKGS